MSNQKMTAALLVVVGVVIAAAYYTFVFDAPARDDFHVVEDAEGTLYFYSYQGDKPPVIVARAPDGREQILAQDEVDWHIEPELSPDGKTLVFAAGQSMGALAIKRLNLESGASTEIIGAPGKSFSAPTFFKDGSRIAYNELISSEGTSKLFVANADGSQPLEVPTGLSGRQEQPDVSPDGRYIVFAGGPIGAETLDLYVYDLAHDSTYQLTDTEAYERFPIFSPDGATIWFSLDEGDGFKLASMSLAGALSGNLTPVVRWSAPVGDAYFVRFSHDGNELLVSHGNWGDFQIARVPLNKITG